MTGDSSIAALVARQAIVDVIYSYCRALDRMDRALAATVFHVDANVDYGRWFNGSGEEFVDWVWAAHAGFDTHSHQVTNVLIDLDASGVAAASEAYVTAQLCSRANQGVLVTSRGRYLDRWSRREGRWAIDHRRYVDDITVTTAVQAGLGTGRRDRDDPSYEVLGR